MKVEIQTLQDEKEDIAKQAQREISQKNKSILEKDSLIVVQRSKIDRLFGLFPVLSEYEFIMRLCETIRLPVDIINSLFKDKTVSYTGKLYSPEHKQVFDAENVKVAIAKDAKSNKPFLALGGISHVDWFKEQKKKFLESIGIKVNETKKQMGQSR